MTKRHYSRSMKCSHEGCKEHGHWTFSSQKEMSSHHDRVKTYLCTRHINPKEVLGLNNPKVETTLKCKQLLYRGGPDILGKFWQTPDQEGTEKGGGFHFGDGYRAYAEDFPEGTIIKITAEVILP